MKQAYASAMSGNTDLDSKADVEKPVDRLAALGAAQWKRADEAATGSALASLGVDLIGLKFGRRFVAFWPAAAKLAEALSWRSNLKPWERTKVAQWAIHEWVSERCPRCNGAKEVPAHDVPDLEGQQPMKCCPPMPEGCGGTGKRRYSDAERKEAMGDPFEQGMADAHGLIGQAEKTAMARANNMLEKY